MKVKPEVIKEARFKKQLSQENMAHYLGISQSQYSKLENAEVDFEVTQLGKLLDVLEINPLEVIEFSEKQQVFINSPQSGYNIQNNSFNDINLIRKVIREELKKEGF